MNRYIVIFALALVGLMACLGQAEAKHFRIGHHGGHDDHDDHDYHPRHHCLAQITDEILIEEIRVRGIGGGFGFPYRHRYGRRGGLRSHFHGDNRRGGSFNNRKNFEHDQHESDQTEDQGIHKHQVLNQDKTLVRDRVNGVNDVDAFRRGRKHNDGSHTGISSGNSGSFGASSNVESDVDSDFGGIDI